MSLASRSEAAATPLRVPARAGVRAADIARALLVPVQLVLILLVVNKYQLETPAFRNVAAVAAAGFVIHALLPLRFRLPFFVGLSFVGAFVVFGAWNALWLLAIGAGLILVCHLPLSFGARVVLLLLAGAVLAGLRGGAMTVPWAATVWPILGSMFMFRLALYMHALREGRIQPSFTRTLAYFFMLPNMTFALFPVVDYTTFTRTYYDRPAFSIYESGVSWIARGIVHLLLYRVVYTYVVNDPADIAHVGDLVRFLLGTFLLYLRVSGDFHIIVGMLHLFGFRLPETHHLYYMASSFTDFWRRINIYWKDFMMKMVYYPAFFRLRRWGPTTALAGATLIVFLSTWLLHSYQWYWLRGGFPVTAPDALFWGILGVFVIVTSLRELKRPRARTAPTRRWSLSLGFRTVLTFSILCALWSLWSTESVVEWLWMWRAGASGTPLQHLLVVCGVLMAIGIAGYSWDRTNLESPVHMRPAVMLRTSGLLAGLFLIGMPEIYRVAPANVQVAMASLQRPVLNARDATLQHRGYYEKLDMRGQIANEQLWQVVGARSAEWEDLATKGVLNMRSDHLRRDLLPARQVTWNGQSFSTNSLGMRDRERQIRKGDRAFRIALLGPSHAMGNNVADDSTFSAWLERRLNAVARAPYDTVEVLNFAVDGYTLPQQLGMLEDRVLGFAPDVVIVTEHEGARRTVQMYLLALAFAGIDVHYPELRALMAEAGLDDIDRTGIALPFQVLRSAAGAVGIDARMPWGEGHARVRMISDSVVGWTLGRIAETTRRNGAVPVLLALNTVVTRSNGSVHMIEQAHQSGFVVLDLFDVFDGQDFDALRVAPWDNHPNARAHALIADRLFEELRASTALPPALRGAAQLSFPQH